MTEISKPPLRAVEGVPDSDWVHVGSKDYGAEEDGPRACCQYCHKERLRFVHFLRHPDYCDGTRTIRVGRVCVGRLTGNEGTAVEAERRMLNRAKRRANWLLGWSSNPFKGTHNRKAHGTTFRYVVTQSPRGFSCGVFFEVDRVRGKRWLNGFKTFEEAALAGFDSTDGSERPPNGWEAEPSKLTQDGRSRVGGFFNYLRPRFESVDPVSVRSSHVLPRVAPPQIQKFVQKGGNRGV